MTRALEQAPLPIALFRAPRYNCVIASEPWRKRFGRQLPTILTERLARAYLTQRTITVKLRGTARTSQVVIQPAADELLATCIDYTELHGARAEAARVRKFKAQAFTAMSHDLRGPISTILLWERVLREQGDNAETRERAVDAIRETALSQAKLLTDLVRLSTVIADRADLLLDRVDIASLLADAIEAEVPAANAKQITLCTDVQPRLGYVYASVERLQTAFAKIFETAIRVNPSGSKLDVSARRRQGRVVITIGKPNPDANRESFAGLDLGLVVAGELLAMHAGTLKAERLLRAQGATFAISLPLLTART